MPDPAAAENYWGTEFPQQTADSPPVVLLKEQADILTQVTGTKVRGGLKQSVLGGTLFTSLYLSASSRDDYQFKLLYIAHPVFADPKNPFPLTAEDSIHERQQSIRDMDEFRRWLKELLSSEVVQATVGVMMT